MAIKAVLFDLDGTLLPMDQNQFLKGYFGLLTEKMVKSGYNAKTFMKALLTGTDAMVANDGSMTNEALFWREFGKFYTPETLPPITLFDEFYEKDFPKTKAFCGYDARPRKIVDTVKEKILTNSDIDGVIPSGTAIQNLRGSYIGDTLLTRDGYHLSYDIGRYAAALTWYKQLTGADLTDLTVIPQAHPRLKVYLRVIKEAVNGAVEQPFSVTEVN